MFFRGRRGQVDEQLWKFLFEAAMLAAVVVAMFFYVSSQVGEDAFFKQYYADDAALLLDSILSVPGDAVVYYEVRDDHEGRYDFTWTNNWIFVSDAGSGMETNKAAHSGSVNEYIPAVSKFMYNKTGNRVVVEAVG